MSNGKFRCVHCGEYFTLNNSENELYEEGWITIEPDCCEDCINNSQCEEDSYSDADNGL
jgi:hypothetical protein